MSDHAALYAVVILALALALWLRLWRFSPFSFFDDTKCGTHRSGVNKHRSGTPSQMTAMP
jgi:hypothetical protein